MWLRKVLVMCLVSCVGAGLSPASSSADDRTRQIELIKEAVIRYICYDEYWLGGMPYKKNEPLTMKILIFDEERFYSVVEDALYLYGIVISSYQVGLLRPDSAVVTHNFEMDMRRRLAEEPVITTTLTVPPDCTPRYDPPTPRKKLMLRTIVNTIYKTTRNWREKGLVDYPCELTLIIADFNIDYLYTYILVEETNDLFKVTLHNPRDYDSDEYERSGWYPRGMVHVKPKSLLEKVRRHGIKKEINICGESSFEVDR